jgi:putative intracellular protease/amidase
MTTTLKPGHRSLRAIGAILLLATLAFPSVVNADQLPVLMVIANRDFYYKEYATVRKELVGQGLTVVVAAGSTARAIPQDLDLGRPVTPDVAVSDVSASDYSAVVFVGGWGASSYQYGFSGTYANAAYQPDPRVAEAVNRLINDFVAQDKYLAGICHGTTVLAWARVDGVSPLAGRTVSAWPGGSPALKFEERTYARGVIPVYWHVVRHGGNVPTSASLGDPLTAADDVVVDGRIITGENWESAPLFAWTLARAVVAR